MSRYYILIDARTLEGIDGFLVRQEQHDIPNGSPALEGELARSRDQFDVAGKKWMNGALVDMTEADLSIIDAQQAAATQALIDARPTRQLERDIIAGLTELDAVIGTAFSTSLPFTPLINDTITEAINDFCGTEQDAYNREKAQRLGTYLLSKMMNIAAINRSALYTEYFGQ